MYVRPILWLYESNTVSIELTTFGLSEAISGASSTKLAWLRCCTVSLTYDAGAAALTTVLACLQDMCVELMFYCSVPWLRYSVHFTHGDDHIKNVWFIVTCRSPVPCCIPACCRESLGCIFYNYPFHRIMSFIVGIIIFHTGMCTFIIIWLLLAFKKKKESMCMWNYGHPFFPPQSLYKYLQGCVNPWCGKKPISSPPQKKL